MIVSFVLNFTTPVTLDEGLKDLRFAEGEKIGPYTVTSLDVVDEESPTAGTSGSTNAPVTTAKKTTQRVLEGEGIILRLFMFVGQTHIYKGGHNDLGQLR